MRRCPATLDLGEDAYACGREAGHAGAHICTLDGFGPVKVIGVTWEDDPDYVPPPPRPPRPLDEWDKRLLVSFATPAYHNRFSTTAVPVLGKPITFRRLEPLMQTSSTVPMPPVAVPRKPRKPKKK